MVKTLISNGSFLPNKVSEPVICDLNWLIFATFVVFSGHHVIDGVGLMIFTDFRNPYIVLFSSNVSSFTKYS